MEWWNSMLCSLPYDWLRYEFMRNALLAVLLVAPIFGLTGTMVVNNRMAFFSDSIGHAALTGVAIGIITGMGNPLWAMIIFAVVFAIFISWFRIKTEASADTVIGVFFAATVALGVVLLSRGGGFNRYSSYLIGDLLSITPQEIGLLILLLIGVLFTWVLYYNKLFLTSFNPAVARSRRVNGEFFETFFAILVALVVTVSIQWVGILVINSLLVLPAATARNAAGSMRSYNLLAVLFSLLSGIIGLILSFYWETATGATIVLCAFFFYILTFIIKNLLSKRH